MSPLVGRPALEGPHLTGRALLLLVAVLLASAPAAQLLAGSSWLLLTLTAAAPVILGGLVLRHVLRRRLLVPLAQAGLILMLVLVVETMQGLAPWGEGLFAVVTAQSDIAVHAGKELAAGLAPMALSAPGTVLVVALIAVMTLVLDIMYLDLGWHTPSGLAIMAAVLFPALQQPAGGAWWMVAAPVLGGGMLLATRTVHPDPRYLRGDRRPQAGPAAHPGRGLAVTALCLLLVAAFTPALERTMPQLAPTRIALTMDVLQRWQDPDAPQPGAVMIDDDVSVRRSLLQQDGVEVLRYTTTAEEPSYLRVRTLNRFNGETFRGDAEGEKLAMGRTAFSDARDDGHAITGGPEDFTASEFTITNLTGDRLPVPENIRSITAEDPSLEEQFSLQPSNGEVALGPVRAGLIGQTYRVQSEPSDATPEALRSVDPAVFNQPFDAGYTARADVPQIATDLAEQVAADAGAETAYDTAVAYQEFFRSSFAYSLTVNSPPGKDPLESFLEDRIGYCEQFAAAFALMMTGQGYPTRVAIGFTPGTQDGEEMSVSAKNAHAWPEVWFGPEHGWVRFEPTPAAAANGVRPPERDDSAEDPAPAPSPETPTAQDEPTEEETSDPATTEEEETAEDPAATQASDGGGAGPSEATVQRVKWGVVIVMAVGGLLAAAAALTVIGIRRRRFCARDERWAALMTGGATAAKGAEGAAALAAERTWRGAGELAWSEISRELSVRETAIRWLRITGAWGRTPTRLGLDLALPPHRALQHLLAQIEAADREVTAEHRAAAARIADAFTAARYAAPLPESAPGETGEGPTAEATPGAQPPLRRDADLLIELIRGVR